MQYIIGLALIAASVFTIGLLTSVPVTTMLLSALVGLSIGLLFGLVIR